MVKQLADCSCGKTLSEVPSREESLNDENNDAEYDYDEHEDNDTKTMSDHSDLAGHNGYCSCTLLNMLEVKFFILFLSASH